MANKTLVDAIRQIIGSKGDITESTDGVWYDIFKRPDLSVNSNISHGRADGGVVKYLSDIKDHIDTVKGDIYGADKDNPSNGTIYKDIKDKHADVASKYNELVVTDTNGHAGKYGDFIAKYKDFTSNDENNPAKYEDFVKKWNVIASGSNIKDEIVRVYYDLLGKDGSGNNYSDNTSKIDTVGKNLLRGVNSEVIKVGSDLLLDNSYIQTVGDNLQKGDNSEIKITSDSISDVKIVGSDLKLTDSKIKEVANDLQKADSAIKNVFTALDQTEAYKNKAADWAEKVDGEVDPGKYSAKYWAQQASDAVSNGILQDDLPNVTRTYTSDKIHKLFENIYASITALSDASAHIDLENKIEPLVNGDNAVTINIAKDSTNAEVFSINADNDKIVFKKAKTYIINISIRLLSSANADRYVKVELWDASNDSVLDSQTISCSLEENEYKTYDYILIYNKPDTSIVETKFNINIDGDSYNLETFDAYIVAVSNIDSDDRALFSGMYNASDNAPNLDNNPPVGSIRKGSMYEVSIAGNFYTEPVAPGDLLIAKKDDPTSLSDWVVLNRNITEKADSVTVQTSGNLSSNNVQDALEDIYNRQIPSLNDTALAMSIALG